MKIYFIILIAILTALNFSCSLEYPDGYQDRIREYEQNWGNCYNERFVFPENDSIIGSEYLTCILDGRNVVINDHNNDFEGTVTYDFTWITSQPNTTFPGATGFQNRLHISFVILKYFKEISILLTYPSDSLNYTIQKIFSQSEIICASNFIEDSPQFVVSTSCSPNGSILFSSLFSTIKDQKIIIDSFSYQLINGIWHYHLEYLFDEMEITNEVWNESKKIDILGKKRKSDIFVENLLVEDMKCVIDFELTED